MDAPLSEPVVLGDSDDGDDKQKARHVDKIRMHNNTITGLDNKAVLQKLQAIMGELHAIVDGTYSSWRYELLSTGQCKEHPHLKKFAVKFNNHTGGFTDKQVKFVTKELKKEFPHLRDEHNIVIGALLPEALQRIARDALGLTMEDAECYLEEAINELGDEFMTSMKAKVFGFPSNGKAKRKQIEEDDDDVIFVKKRKICNPDIIEKLSRL